MVEKAELQIYTQANAGVLRNSDGSMYSNFSGGVGTNVKVDLDGKNAIIGGADFSAGTAMQASVRLGYQRALSRNSNLVFSANAYLDKSFTTTDDYKINIDNHYDIDNKRYQFDLINKTESWKADSMRLFGRVGYNKNTRWGGYEVGAEVGTRTNGSPNFHNAGGSDGTITVGENKIDFKTNYEYGRERKEGMYGTPYGKVWGNLTSDGALQAIGQIDAHQIGGTLRLTF